MNINEAAKKYCDKYTPCLEVTIRKAFEAGAEYMRSKLEGVSIKNGMKTCVFVKVGDKYLGKGGELKDNEEDAVRYQRPERAESAIAAECLSGKHPERAERYEILICRRKYEATK